MHCERTGVPKQLVKETRNGYGLYENKMTQTFVSDTNNDHPFAVDVNSYNVGSLLVDKWNTVVCETGVKFLPQWKRCNSKNIPVSPQSVYAIKILI